MIGTMSAADRTTLLTALRDLARAAPADLPSLAERLFAPDVAYTAVHPFNAMRGPSDVVSGLLAPLKRALPDLERRDDIFMAGRWKGDLWVAACGTYNGVPVERFLGLAPVDRWVALRFGEVYRLEDDRIAEAWVMLDLLDLFRQYDASPVRSSRGVEGFWPGPAAQDGLRLQPADPSDTQASIDLVEAMIFQGMHGFDGVDHDTMHFERYFTPDMMWYGPGGTGTARGLSGFMRHHEIPFNEAWPDFKGGDHKARFADGPFVFSTGWPSIRGTHTGGDWMGLHPTGFPFEMRVMDFWRRGGLLLKENWVFIDVPHTFLQFGRDLIQEAASLRSA